MTKRFRGTIFSWQKNKWGDTFFITGRIIPLDNEERASAGFFPGRRTPIRTSLVEREFEEGGKKYVETLNSVYELEGKEQKRE